MKYNTEIIKVIRNNNIASGEDSRHKQDIYFMLDYFDLLFHKSLDAQEKIYTQFWNIRDNSREDNSFCYKAACKTLSIYKRAENATENFFEAKGDEVACRLSERPFLGIIQIELVYYIYEKELDAEDLLVKCESLVFQKLEEKGLIENNTLRLRMYRSSTSGDFCFVVKSALIQDIFMIANVINNMAFKYNEEIIRFNTYTNLGIECFKGNGNDFYTLCDETVLKNSDCRFVMRITTYNGYASNLLTAVEKFNKTAAEKVIIKGLFGRYDYSIEISMEQFAAIYDLLCASKILGDFITPENNIEDIIKDEFVIVFRKGIKEGKIKIINERVLSSLASFAGRNEKDDVEYKEIQDRENKLKIIVEKKNSELKDNLFEFQKMEGIFLEERRAFIDISRELSEVIATYVPQGMEDDSNVNWQILRDFKNIYFSLDGESEQNITNIVSLTALEDLKKSYAGREKEALKRFEINPFFYLLLKIYSDGAPIPFGSIPPLAIVHPYHSQRIKAQKGVFTVFPYYIPGDVENKINDMKVGFSPMAMEYMPFCRDCLCEVQLTNPHRIAKQMREIGFKSSDLYPDTQRVAQDMENVDFSI